ncbi:MAG: YggS family pyridoxal phosphate-dependent enzyme [Prosthecobacter sp.]|jgi:pyridoxal phosphate enzyme (YggS family)|uniref:YggS family pyridoxal phosphate-dependent enzyme n=1 Tax=Prosthecobacter sp. TaxID=1965333 RepID=UPI0019E0D534|nr:YggS family pyridoxal phosphate-dependent enzyme [Prosthecobacter sp.]MBE2282197.1 YggS family pyridoxal phosphate-dependent enzyme [Prosthecobacter sp.]
MSDLHDRLQAIHERIHAAATRSGRDPGAIELLAVSKTFPVEAIRDAVDAGQLVFGENKVQELLAKAPQLPSHLQWHLIGHLQSNKVRKILPAVKYIHSIGSLDLARDVDRIAAELGLYPKVYLEVNLAAESSKHGFSPAPLRSTLEDLYTLRRLEIQGLMCIPPFDPDAAKSRPYFVQLRELRDELEKAGGAPLPLLSMGMSHDFEIAIEEGATIVRVGSAIFGDRKARSIAA